MQCTAHDPLYDVDPQTGVSIEVFYADRTLETSAEAARLVLVVSPSAAFPSGPATGPSLRATQHIATR